MRRGCGSGSPAQPAEIRGRGPAGHQSSAPGSRPCAVNRRRHRGRERARRPAVPAGSRPDALDQSRSSGESTSIASRRRGRGPRTGPRPARRASAGARCRTGGPAGPGAPRRPGRSRSRRRSGAGLRERPGHRRARRLDERPADPPGGERDRPGTEHDEPVRRELVHEPARRSPNGVSSGGSRRTTRSAPTARKAARWRSASARGRRRARARGPPRRAGARARGPGRWTGTMVPSLATWRWRAVGRVRGTSARGQRRRGGGEALAAAVHALAGPARRSGSAGVSRAVRHRARGGARPAGVPQCRRRARRAAGARPGDGASALLWRSRVWRRRSAGRPVTDGPPRAGLDLLVFGRHRWTSRAAGRRSADPARPGCRWSSRTPRGRDRLFVLRRCPISRPASCRPVGETVAAPHAAAATPRAPEPRVPSPAWGRVRVGAHALTDRPTGERPRPTGDGGRPVAIEHVDRVHEPDLLRLVGHHQRVGAAPPPKNGRPAATRRR